MGFQECYVLLIKADEWFRNTKDCLAVDELMSEKTPGKTRKRKRKRKKKGKGKGKSVRKGEYS
jgi:hypothetical protein